MTACYIYIRFSTPKQEEGSSETRQLDACRALIERKGWTEIDVIPDLGRSAWKGNHLTKGNLGKFANRIFNHEIPRGSIIVCENLDRLSRQKARITLKWMEQVCDAGMQIATVTGDKLYNTENFDQSILSMLEVLLIAEGANRYPELLSTRVKASYADRLKKARIDNTPITTQGPAWLKCVDGKWQHDPQRAKIVREIFDMTVAGKSPWAIAGILNERRCPSFGGRAWERTAIVKILHNPGIEGDYVVGVGKGSVPTGEVLYGYYGDPVVPLNIVAQARAILGRRKVGKGRTSESVNNLFGSKIRCGACGGRMMQAGYQSRYLVCYEANRHNGCDQRDAFKYRPFESATLDAVLHLALDETYFRQAEKSNYLSLEIAELEKAIRDKRATKDRAYDMWDRTQSPTAEQRFLEAEADLTKLEASRTNLNEKFEMAQGVANADAHLERVHGVREALSHEDEAVRLPARLRVSEALVGLIDYVSCNINLLGEKNILAVMIGGAHSIVFDSATGRVLLEMSPATEDGAAKWGELGVDKAKLETYFRRRATAS
jgi:DNA invertase Pin-like site-specific DNA recombinase